MNLDLQRRGSLAQAPVSRMTPTPITGILTACLVVLEFGQGFTQSTTDQPRMNLDLQRRVKVEVPVQAQEERRERVASGTVKEKLQDELGSSKKGESGSA